MPPTVVAAVGGGKVGRRGCLHPPLPTAVPVVVALELAQPKLFATHPGWIVSVYDVSLVGIPPTSDGNCLPVPVGEVGYDAEASWGIDCLWIPTDEARSNTSSYNSNNSLILSRIAELVLG